MQEYLGKHVKHKDTLFKGTVMCITIYLDGNTKVGVLSSELSDGKPIPWQFFHVTEVEVID